MTKTQSVKHPLSAELCALLFAALSVFILVALMSYNISDRVFTGSTYPRPVLMNLEGLWGAAVADGLFFLLGFAAYWIPVFLMIQAWCYYQKKSTPSLFYRVLLVSFIIADSAVLSALYLEPIQTVPLGNGGIVGQLGWHLTFFMGNFGAPLLLAVIALFSLQCLFHFSWKKIILSFKVPSFTVPKFRFDWKLKPKAVPVSEQPMIDKVMGEQKAKPKNTRRIQTSLPIPQPTRYLDDRRVNAPEKNQAELNKKAREIEENLADFGFDAQVVSIYPGPVVTRYEISLSAGTKVSKITAISKDLARSLSVLSVRVVEVIPGKSVIGLELPNENRQMVSLKEILQCKQYENSKSTLPLVLGKDISGQSVIVDLAKMPHLLVAGTTGSGKSVGLNVMILSMILKSSPENLRLILIDPKMLELSVYADIPHLLTPVVTQMNNAATALRWCVAEMERRYQIMASLGVRNIDGYNAKVKKMNEACADGNAEGHEILPSIVVIADEFADLFMVVGKKIEQLIARLAQKARAAGIHLILATQRPSVDVITGLIKANIPSRISYKVSSRVDSRTILDQQGAEQLLGHGDMLYLPSGSSTPIRVHGSFVSDEEVHRIVAAIKKHGSPDYQAGIVTYEDAQETQESLQSSHGEQDALYDQAVYIVTKTRKASISSVQRRLRIGYNRAANLIEAMEHAGVISPMESNGSRTVLAPEPVEDQ